MALGLRRSRSSEGGYSVDSTSPEFPEASSPEASFLSHTCAGSGRLISQQNKNKFFRFQSSSYTPTSKVGPRLKGDTDGGQKPTRRETRVSRKDGLDAKSMGDNVSVSSGWEPC